MIYEIPHAVIATFLEHAVNNFEARDDSTIHGPVQQSHVETLAILIGTKDGENIRATDIIFPQQSGTPDLVDDKGKHLVMS